MSKAAILVETGKPLQIGDLTLPELGVGQVLVRMQYAAICGAQLNEIDAVKGPDKYLPHLLGHEGVGTVEAIGPGVTTKEVGDKVICHWRPSEGIAAKGPVYDWNGTKVNAGPMACFAEQCVVSENRLTKVPVRGHWLKDTVWPLFGCAYITAYGVVVNDAKVKPGEEVMVIGCGGVGLALIQVLKAVSAEVVAVEPNEAKHDLVDKCRADWIVPDTNVGGSFDVVIDTTGKSAVIQEAVRLTKPNGRTILVGVPNHDDPITLHTLPLHLGKSLIGSEGGDSLPHEDIPRLAAMCGRDGLWPEALITHEFRLEDVNEAVAIVRSGDAGRVLLRMHE